jgi:hypothetical protein
MEVEARDIQLLKVPCLVQSIEPSEASPMKARVNPSGVPGEKKLLEPFVPEAPYHGRTVALVATGVNICVTHQALRGAFEGEPSMAPSSGLTMKDPWIGW